MGQPKATKKRVTADPDRVDESSTKKTAKSATRRRPGVARAGTGEARVAVDAEEPSVSSRDRVRLPVMDMAGNLRTVRPTRREDGGETALRFRLATLLRISDSLVTGAVRAYDRLFDVGREEKAQIYLEMGVEYSRSGKPHEALSSLRKATTLKPNLTKAWLELGKLYMRKEALDAAIVALQKAKEVGEPNIQIHYLLGEALIERGRHDEALVELETLVRMSPTNAVAWYRLGFVNDHLTRYDEAIESFEQAIELDPEEPSYHQALGFTLESNGQRKEAVKCFKVALELEERTRH